MVKLAFDNGRITEEELVWIVGTGETEPEN